MRAIAAAASAADFVIVVGNAFAFARAASSRRTFELAAVVSDSAAEESAGFVGATACTASGIAAAAADTAPGSALAASQTAATARWAVTIYCCHSKHSR